MPSPAPGGGGHVPRLEWHAYPRPVSRESLAPRHPRTAGRPFVRPAHGPAFTLIELLVVMGIMAVLAAAVIVAGTTLLTKARVQATVATLSLVRDAVEEFKRGEEAAPTITRARWGERSETHSGTYADRYGLYPPDELDAYTDQGLPAPAGAPPTAKALKLTRGSAVIEPSVQPYYSKMQFRTDLAPDALSAEHRDLAALILTIELYSAPAAAILDRVPSRHRSNGAIDPATGLPTQYLDIDPNSGPGFRPGVDHQIRYILDDWGVPISYLAQRDWNAGTGAPIRESTNYADSNAWNQASTEMIRLNSDQPIIMSYGPNGKEQCTQAWMGGTADASLVADWMGLTVNLTTAGKIDHPLNADNVYADPELASKLARGR
ncbi:MAG TPA: prepilin-type N-terminal cleavage/methylation domain-containing protein [Phycisphaerae bacterium]|nr:prepilin-type N-terminal cleavage/methylation domain-containing protein [Phycisphaerae bacterium]HNU45356.1 prepilin-type N-terminal cleavage/methylation domain-containing protein [Phycisphaerae bacterium]